MLFRFLFRDQMVVYTAHEPPNPPPDQIDRAASVEFVKDGFSFLAAIAPPVWLIANSLWLELAAWLAAAAALIVAMDMAQMGESWQLLVLIALNIWFGFEVAGIRRWNLERKGWEQIGTVTGSSLLDCERRFFDSWTSVQSSEPSDAA